LLKIPAAKRLKQRYAKFRAFGHFSENKPTPKINEAKAEPKDSAALR
jgi:hypothetical protein